MKANLVIHTNPFRPNLNVEKSHIQPGMTIFDVLISKGLLHDTGARLVRTSPYVVLINGTAVTQSHWNTYICDEDVIQILHLPRGGGGGGSNIGAIVTAVVMAVMAYFTFGMSLAMSAAVGVVAYAAMTMLTGAVPQPSTSLGTNREANSPTYSLSSQGNSARLLEAIPRIYGEVRVYPDLASQPYSEYQGNEQYLYQLFCVSLGDVDIVKIYVDDNDIDNFDDAEYQIIKPNEAVTLFPDNVITSDSVNGIELPAPNNPGYLVSGPFAASPPGTEINYIGIDIALPRGLANIDTQTGDYVPRSLSMAFEYRDLTGGPWISLGLPTLTMATQQPQLLSYKVQVPMGRYEVRAFRVSNETGDGKSLDQLQWVALRGYAPPVATYGNVTLIAVAMRATGTLNSQTARKFSVLARGKVQTWDPINGWSALQYSNNPAWAAADILRNPDYGRGMSTDRFNIQKLYQLSQTWEARGDTFNGTFDVTYQLWDALSKVLRVGRTVPMYYAGIIDFIRDEPQSVVTAHFHPGNMIAGSFSTVYNFHSFETPDHVIMEYTNPETGKPDEVKCVLPGETALNPIRVQLFGCTNRAQAWREGISMAAGNRDRRRSIEFTTARDGLIPQYNDLVRVSHDVPSWGYSGRVYSLDRVTGQLITSEPIPFDAAGDHYIAFRKRNGMEDGPYKIVADSSIPADANYYGCIVQASTEQLAAIYISDGTREDYTFYQAGPSERRGLLALVMKMRPDSEGRVKLTLINAADSVHTAENGGSVPPPAPGSNFPDLDPLPIVDSVTVVYTVTVGEQHITASAARGAIYYEFQAMLSGTGTWQSLGTNSSPQLTVNLSPGVWSVRVRGVGVSAGPWATWNGTIEATTLPTPRLTSLVASKKIYAIGLSWAYDPTMASITAKVQIYENVTNNLGSSSLLVELPYPANAFDRTGLAAAESRYFWARCVDTAGRVGPWFNNGTAILGMAEDNATKYTQILTGQISETMLDQELRETISGGGAAMVAVEELTNELAAMRTVKTQLTVDGKIYTAGFGVGVENNDGIIQSQFLVAASTFAVFDPNSGVTQQVYPFIIKNGQVYINSLIVDNAVIQEALIGATLESVAKDAQGNPLIRLNFQTGEFEMRGAIPGQGVTRVNNRGFYLWDSAGNIRIELGEFLT